MLYVIEFYKDVWNWFTWPGRVLFFWLYVLAFPMIFLGLLLFYLIDLCVKDEENG